MRELLYVGGVDQFGLGLGTWEVGLCFLVIGYLVAWLLGCLIKFQVTKKRVES
jgi:hypothetical protein